MNNISGKDLKGSQGSATVGSLAVESAGIGASTVSPTIDTGSSPPVVNIGTSMYKTSDRISRPITIYSLICRLRASFSSYLALV